MTDIKVVSPDYASGFQDCLDAISEIINESIQQHNGGTTANDVVKIFNDLVFFIHKQRAEIDELIESLESISFSDTGEVEVELSLAVDNTKGGR